jgi:hypothetical protein
VVKHVYPPEVNVLSVLGHYDRLRQLYYDY